MDELKRVKGDKTWPQWELEMLTAQYPDNATFKAALEQYNAKAATTTTPPGTTEQGKADKETKATNATTAKAKKNTGKKTGKTATAALK